MDKIEEKKYWYSIARFNDRMTDFVGVQETLCKGKEKQELLAKYRISLKELPKIKADDPAIVKLNAKEGDDIKIRRQSPTAEESIFYRGV